MLELELELVVLVLLVLLVLVLVLVLVLLLLVLLMLFFRMMGAVMNLGQKKKKKYVNFTKIRRTFFQRYRTLVHFFSGEKSTTFFRDP